MYSPIFNEGEFYARKAYWSIGRAFWCGQDTWEAGTFLLLAEDEI